MKPESSRDKKKPDTFGKAYVAGNVVEGNARVTKNNWDGGVQVYDMPDAGKFTDQIRVNEPFSMPHVTIMDAKTAYNYVFLKSATKPFNLLLACTCPLVTEFADN